MKSSKIGIIFLVSIIALAGIGISYSGFSDQITVTGTINTGYVRFDIVGYSGTWVWKEISSHTKIVHNGAVALTDLNGNGILDDDPNGYYSDPDYMLVAYSYGYDAVGEKPQHFAFINLFPCIYFNADFKFTIGTIPVFLTGTDLVWTNQKINNQAATWIPTIPGHEPPVVTVTITDQAGNVIYPGQTPIQLHPGITYTWNLQIHIPQDDAYMNAYAEGSCTFNIIQWSECEPTTQSKTITIPTDPQYLTMTVFGPFPPGYGYFRTHLTNVPAGAWSPPIAEGADCVGWCVDNTGPYSTIWTETPYRTYMYDSYSLPTSLPGGWPVQPWMTDPDWPKVNWILNNKGSATPQQIQDAIWGFVDGGYGGSDPVVLNLIAGANANPLYVPPAGQTPPAVVAVICWVDAAFYNHQYQTTIIEVDP